MEFLQITNITLTVFWNKGKEIIFSPTGAPKATLTPAAEAADKISRFFASFLPNQYLILIDYSVLTY